MSSSNINAPENIPAPKKKKTFKPLTVRLAKTKNFWKEDRSLDDYLDRTKLLNNGEKRLIRKMLKLRSREDRNTVKVTIMGLGKLLGTHVNSIRRNLRGLEKKGFVFQQPDYWGPKAKFPKKVFGFPATFPGFDLSTVFIRKGAKARYMAKEEAKKNPEETKRLKEKERQERKESRELKRRMEAQDTPTNNAVCTPTKNAPLIDFSPSKEVEHGKLSSKAEEYKYSSPPEESVTFARTPNAARCASGRVAEAQFPEPMKSNQINFHHEGLRNLIYDLLKEHGLQRQFLYVSRFFNRILNEESLCQNEADRVEIATFLYEYMMPDLIARLARSSRILEGLFSCLAKLVKSYTPDSYWASKEGQSEWGQTCNMQSWIKETQDSINRVLGPKAVRAGQVYSWMIATGYDPREVFSEYPILWGENVSDKEARNSVWHLATQGKSVFNRPREKTQVYEQQWN